MVNSIRLNQRLRAPLNTVANRQRGLEDKHADIRAAEMLWHRGLVIFGNDGCIHLTLAGADWIEQEEANENHMPK